MVLDGNVIHFIQLNSIHFKSMGMNQDQAGFCDLERRLAPVITVLCFLSTSINLQDFR